MENKQTYDQLVAVFNFSELEVRKMVNTVRTLKDKGINTVKTWEVANIAFSESSRLVGPIHSAAISELYIAACIRIVMLEDEVVRLTKKLNPEEPKESSE